MITPTLLFANDLLFRLAQKATDSLPQIDAALTYPMDKTLSDLHDFETIFTGNAAEIRAAWFHAFRGIVEDDKWWSEQAVAYSSTASFNWVMGRFASSSPATVASRHHHRSRIRPASR
jgi:hypothetical protein